MTDAARKAAESVQCAMERPFGGVSREDIVADIAAAIAPHFAALEARWCEALIATCDMATIARVTKAYNESKEAASRGRNEPDHE